MWGISATAKLPITKERQAENSDLKGSGQFRFSSESEDKETFWNQDPMSPLVPPRLQASF
jgi:hypothetical protein